MRCAGLSWVLGFILAASGTVRAGTNYFQLGIAAYAQKDFANAANFFTAALGSAPAANVFQNLGNAEWEQGKTAAAVIAWERALSLNPFDRNAENNLKFAREVAQLEAPELTWCEIASTWLPADWWAWVAGVSLWFAVGMMLLPGMLRWRKSARQQALVALGLGVFLLGLPANYGAVTRARLGFALVAELPLRLTPTAEGETATKLAAGEPGRVVRERGRYLLVQTRRHTGWVEREKFGRICSP